MVTMEKDENSQMLNPKEVADILGVHQKTVHLWLRTGKIEGIKISYRAWRIPRSTLASFIERNKNTQPNEASKNDPKNPAPSNSEKNTEHRTEGSQDMSSQGKMKHYIRDIMGENPK